MIDAFIEELEQLVQFKNTTAPGDIVVIASEEPKMVLYALVTIIEPDPQRKKSWWNVSMQFLTLPPQKVVWTLREPQFTGQEVFTFDGVEHFMKAVLFEANEPLSSSENSEGKNPRPAPQAKLRIVK